MRSDGFRLALSRRAFLQSLLVAGCGAKATASPGSDASCVDLPGLVRLGRIAFVDEGAQPFDVPVGEGLDGRLYTDLSTLAPGDLVTPNERFYIRTRVPDRIDYAKAWRIELRRLDGRGAELTIPDLTERARPFGPALLECSGNARGGGFGLMSAAAWSGVPLVDVLSAIETPPDARVLVSGFDEHSRPSERSVPGASWIFTYAQLQETGAFLATAMNGAPLPPDHGFPVRLVVPGWYGCTCIKWVDTVRVVGADEPSTAHMREFASRTHQVGEPSLAREFRPASIDLAAMPVRIERVRLEGGERLLVTGVYWGGDALEPSLELAPTSATQMRAVAVQLCAGPREARSTWGLWSVVIDVPPNGTHEVRLQSAAPAATQRLDRGYYARSFSIG